MHLLVAYEVSLCFLPSCLFLEVRRRMAVQWNQGTLSSMHFRVSPIMACLLEHALGITMDFPLALTSVLSINETI